MRTYTTWQVMRLLERHPDWTAEAPKNNESGDIHAERARPLNDGSATVFEYFDDGWIEGSPNNRSDWTIKKPKKKRERKVAPERISGSCSLHFYAHTKAGPCMVASSIENLDPSKTYRLLLVEVES